jgi:predicted enzyme related to lactoylglutathione lyase
MPSIAHFDIPAEDVERAKRFYSELFGWKLEKPPGPMEYYMIETADLEGKPGVGGGLGERQGPDQQIVNYIGVPSVDEYSTRVTDLGGTVIQPKMTVPGFGYLATCMDTENNVFGLWQDDENAK